MPVNLLNEKDLNKYLADIIYHGQEMEVFTAGNFKSTAFVEQNKDAIIRSMLLQWSKHRLRSHLAEDLPEHRQFLVPVTADEPDLPAWAGRCLAESKPVHRFVADKIPARLSDNIGMIRDYLYSAAESYINKTLARVKDSNAKGKEDVSPKLHIDYLKTNESYDTFAKALDEAQKWHDIMAEKAALRSRNEAMYQASLSGTESVMKLKNGMEIVQLTTPDALDYESEYMGHCVGDGGYDEGVRKGITKIYSLRDKDGMPHTTFEVRVNSETGKEEIHQCKGKGNKAPVDKYRPSIQEFVIKKDFEIVGDQKNIGLIRLYDEETKKSQFYDLYSLPKGKKLICKGNLDLCKMELTELPDLSNIIVGGYFDCSGNQLTSLEGAPQEVGGNFYCSENQLTSLEGAPQEVKGMFDCSFNKLTSLRGAPQKVGGDFYCYCNQLTSLEGAPQEVGGYFDCYNNQLTSLEGAPQEVSGDFKCNDNQLTSLEHAPQNVGGDFDCSCNQLTSLRGAPQEVGGNFDCSGNQLTTLEHAPQKVGGDFNCERNQLTSLRGAPQKVGGSFYCSSNQLTSLEGAPQEVGRHFYCYNNQLTSLRGAPQEVGGSFNCYNNQLTSLRGAPQEVRGNFYCTFNKLTSLLEISRCRDIHPNKDICRKYVFGSNYFSYEDLLKSPVFLQEKAAATRQKLSKNKQQDIEPAQKEAKVNKKMPPEKTFKNRILSFFKKPFEK